MKKIWMMLFFGFGELLTTQYLGLIAGYTLWIFAFIIGVLFLAYDEMDYRKTVDAIAGVNKKSSGKDRSVKPYPDT